MNIEKAQKEQLPIVKEITHRTIQEIYPRYYADGAVAFFLSHHSDSNILEDILAGKVFLLVAQGNAIGTVTI